MLYEILNSIAVAVATIIIAGTWRDTGYAGRSIGVAVLLLLVGLLISSRWYAVERMQVVAVNRDRSEPLTFAVGESIEFSRAERKGLLEPYQLAARRASDGRLEVLENKNSLVLWKFNKQALQMELIEGVSYDLKVAGWYGHRIVIDIVQPVPPERRMPGEDGTRPIPDKPSQATNQG